MTVSSRKYAFLDIARWFCLGGFIAACLDLSTALQFAAAGIAMIVHVGTRELWP